MPKQRPLLSLNEKTEREDINDYEWSCQTIVTMGNIVSQNINGICYQARPLMTSDGNPISKSTEVTPDLEIEAPSNSDPARYRAVNEIKANLPKNQDYWADDINQLRKYDDELTGWSRPFPDMHDIIFTTKELRTHAYNK